MKTENQESMPMFAIIHNLRCGQSVAGIAARPYLESVEADLRRLESEHAALLAVAEVLRNVSNCHNSGNNGAYMGEAVLCRYHAESANKALANLNAVREVNL